MRSKIKKPVIYCLKDPRNNYIRYIGFTTQPLYERLSGHIQTINRSNNRKNNWIKNLLKNNLRPIIELVEECNYDNWQEREIYWIEYYMNKYDNITNSSKGGESTTLGIKYSKERILSMSKPIYQYSLKGEFIKKWDMAIDAAKHLNVTKSGLTAAALNETYSGGYQWRYYYSNSLDPVIPKLLRCPILQYDKNMNYIKEWETAAEVQRVLNIKSANISKVLRNKRKYAGNFIWKYKVELP